MTPQVAIFVASAPALLMLRHFPLCTAQFGRCWTLAAVAASTWAQWGFDAAGAISDRKRRQCWLGLSRQGHLNPVIGPIQDLIGHSGHARSNRSPGNPLIGKGKMHHSMRLFLFLMENTRTMVKSCMGLLSGNLNPGPLHRSVISPIKFIYYCILISLMCKALCVDHDKSTVLFKVFCPQYM